MTKFKLEYIWLDGYVPTQSIRAKTKILDDTKFSGKLEECPMWAFDGSSTEQAPGNSSDCLLKPVALYSDPDRRNAFLVMCEVLNADGTPHASNARAAIGDDDDDFWFGFEQEAKDKGIDIKLGKFPFSASGKAKAAGSPEGFVKIIFDAKYGELLGAHLIGYNVTELIAEIVAVRNLETTGMEIIKSVHPHPTMSEAIMEASAAAYGEVIHL